MKVASLSRVHKRFQQSSLLRRFDRPPAPLCNMLTSPAYQLTSVFFAHLEHLGDTAVRIVKCFAKNVGGALGWSELFHQKQHRKLKGLGPLRA